MSDLNIETNDERPPAASRPRASASRDIAALLDVMRTLRTPGIGCPWDLAQSFETIAPYTIEEAYEVADAIARQDMLDLRDELGDLLLQVVFHARIAEEQGHFAFPDVVEAITGKLVRRHPHVFGDETVREVGAVNALWDAIKAAEREARATERGEGARDAGLPSALDGVVIALPALTRADKLTRKAAAVGFTWTDAASVLGKIEEELGEVREALDAGSKPELEGEIGDLLFTIANLARHVGIDAEAALAGSNTKFERRFKAIEAALRAEGRTPAQSDLAEMDRLWTIAKLSEQDLGEGDPVSRSEPLPGSVVSGAAPSPERSGR